MANTKHTKIIIEDKSVYHYNLQKEAESKNIL